MKDHSFCIGKRFASVESAQAEDYLNAALKAHSYIKQFEASDTDGVYWRNADNSSIDSGFQHGGAGIAYFCLQLYKTTRREEYLRTARDGFRYTAVHWRNQLEMKNPAMKFFEYNFGSGLGGVAKALLVWHRETGDAGALSALREIAKEYSDNAVWDGAQVGWTGSPGFALGDAGIAVILLNIAKVLCDDKLRSLAVAAAKTISESAKPGPRGGKSWDIVPDGYAHSFPNFVIGTSGIAYAMSVFYEDTRDADFLSAAKSAVEYLRVIAVRQKDGFLVPLTDDPNERTFYVGGCHGPEGTSKVFYQLYRLTGEDSYKGDIENMAKGLLSLGVPELQSPGYWNNTCICCGTASVLQFFISLYAAFGDARYLDVAERCAKILLGEAEEMRGGGLAWPLAEVRLEPCRISVDKGYMHGAAGIASALLQLYQTKKRAFDWSRLPDDPYPGVTV
jgi:lantibiotic modifying enzyme